MCHFAFHFSCRLGDGSRCILLPRFQTLLPALPLGRVSPAFPCSSGSTSQTCACASATAAPASRQGGSALAHRSAVRAWDPRSWEGGREARREGGRVRTLGGSHVLNCCESLLWCLPLRSVKQGIHIHGADTLYLCPSALLINEWRVPNRNLQTKSHLPRAS